MRAALVLLGDDVRSGWGVRDQSGGFGAGLVDVNRGRRGRSLVEGVRSPEATETKDQGFGRKASRRMFELFDCFRGVVVEREGDALDD